MQWPTVVRNTLLGTILNLNPSLHRHVSFKEFKAGHDPLNPAFVYFPSGASLALVSNASGSDLAVLGTNDCSLLELYPSEVYVRCSGHAYVMDRGFISTSLLSGWVSSLHYRIIQWLEYRATHKSAQNAAQYLLLFGQETIAISQQAIAHAIGARRETVSEAIVAFEEQGLVLGRSRSNLRINEDAMRAFVLSGDFPSVIQADKPIAGVTP